jgi:hypothetical protein
VGLVQLELCAFDLRQVVFAKNRNGDGVFEDEWRCVVELMRGAAHGDSKGGA